MSIIKSVKKVPDWVPEHIPPRIRQEIDEIRYPRDNRIPLHIDVPRPIQKPPATPVKDGPSRGVRVFDMMA